MRLTRSTLHLEVGGRAVTLQGEALLPGKGNPEFIVYANTLERWDDGQMVTPLERRRILRAIEDEAALAGRRIEIE